LFLTKHHAIKTYWGSGGLAPHINIGTRWRWVVSFMPQLLYPWGKSPQYSLDRRLIGPQIQSWHSGKEKESYHCSCQELKRGCPAHSLVSILTELLQLPYLLLSMQRYLGVRCV